MNPSFQDKIAKLQEDYYTTNTKHRFFKSSQKLDCATAICNEFDPILLFNKAIYIIPNTNRIYFDYPVFKTFANPDMFEPFVSYIYQLIYKIIQQYSQYEMHVNWQTYSVSAHKRYKDLYQVFLTKYENTDINFHDNLSNLYVYYTPTVIQLISNIMTQLLHPVILGKIILYNKTDSEELLHQLLPQNEFVLKRV